MQSISRGNWGTGVIIKNRSAEWDQVTYFAIQHDVNWNYYRTGTAEKTCGVFEDHGGWASMCLVLIHFLLNFDIMGCICKIAVFRHCVGLIDHQNVIAKAMASVHVKQMCYHNFCTKWLVSFPALYQRWVFSWFFLFRLVFMSYVMLWKRGETADTQLRRLAPNHQLKMALLIFRIFRLLFSQSEEVEMLDPSLFVSMRQTISQALLHSFTA